MKAVTIAGAAISALIGASFAYAATSNNPDMTKNAPVSVNESAPSKAGMKEKGKAGEAVMPQRSSPSSVSESAPSKTGKEKTAPKMNDSPNMPNPKAPTSVNESMPSKPHK